jgi:VWFA-related protein
MMLTKCLGGPVAVAVILQASGVQQPQPFRSSAEVIAIDTLVVGRDGTPVEGLRSDQFEVFIDGRRRPVVLTQFVRSTDERAIGAVPAVAGTDAVATRGRVIVLAVDQGSFPVAGQASAREAAMRVVNAVAPDDYLGFVAFPGSLSISPTRDREAVRQAVTRIAGLRVDVTRSRFNISAAEASQLKGRDSVATGAILERECRFHVGDPTCRQEIIQDGGRIADALEQQGAASLTGLRSVLDAVASLPGRKTLILVSAGLPLRPGGTPNLDSETAWAARRAAAANINLYVLYMNVHFLQAFSAEYGRRNHTLYEDISMFGYGLEKLADSAGGSFFQVEVDSDPFVARAIRETSAWYVLGVEARPEDRDGKDHYVRVAVKQRGTQVRYRRVVNIPRPRF